MGQLKGKVALITGASKGIGHATALKLARAGAKVVAAATNEDLLEELSREIDAFGAESSEVQCDVTDPLDCDDLVQDSLDRFGKIDILVNCAGIGYSGKIVDSDPKEVEQMVKVNLLGVYNITRAALPSMLEHKGGDIINVGSVASFKYSPNFAIYSATKFAVRAFSEALRNEVQENDIRVTLVHPGMTQTPFFDSFLQGGSPLPSVKGDILRPEEIAEAIMFALVRPRGVALNEITVRPTWQER